MTPQNPFNTWENSEEYYGLQDQIADIKMQQQNYKTNLSAGMFGKSNAYTSPETQKQLDMRLGEFDRKLQTLNRKSEQGRLNFDFQRQNHFGSSRSAVNGVKFNNNF